MSEEHLRDRHGAAAVADPDLGADGEILHRGFDQIFRPRRTIDVDRLGTVLIPRDRHKRAEPCSVIVMMMGNEDRPDVAGVNAGLGQSARGPVAGIDDIGRVVDDQQIGRLCAMRPRRRARCRAKRDEAGAFVRHVAIVSAFDTLGVADFSVRHLDSGLS